MSKAGNSTGVSRSIVKKGDQGVSDRGKHANEKAVVPASTLRALQLRNGRGGSFGTGEVMKIPGREKLELIAEDEMEKAQEERRRNLYEANMNSSLKAPFQLETVLKIAQSQMDAYIDFIDALHKHDLCYDFVLRETEAHCPPKVGRKDPDSMLVPSFVAEQFGVCVHNAYMLASGWVILYESFQKLQCLGLRDKDIHMQLKTNPEIHDVYFSAYDLLKKLVFGLQHRLRSIVQNTPHYANYFKSTGEAKDFQEFEISEMKKMYQSFLDSVIVELCLPGSKFSPQALYFCLHAAQEESPKQLKRCPQIMWDAVGDLAEAVRLMDIMETPLVNRTFGHQAEEFSSTIDEVVRWNKTQTISIRSAMQYSNFVNIVYPLTNLKDKSALDKIWDRLNANYVRESGQNIDALWRLVNARHRVPHFSTVTVSTDLIYGSAKQSGKELVRVTGNEKQKLNRIEEASDGEDSASSMPSLKAVSDSEDEYEEFMSSEESSDEEDEEFDEDGDQDLKRQQREAIERSLEDPEVLDLENNKYADERKKNPLLSLLGNLRGRLFSSSSILRTDEVMTPASKTSDDKKSPAKPSVAPGTSADRTSAASEKVALAKTNVEDAENESDEPKAGEEKKKKKPKKKRKKKKTNSVDVKLPAVEPPVSPVSEPPRSPSPALEPQIAPPLESPSPKADKKTAPKSPSIKTPSFKTSISDPTAFASTATLPLPHDQKAPSAHSYLKEINEAKTKVKTRREQPPVEMPPEKKERRSMLDRIRGKDRDIPKENTKEKSSFDVFGRLKKKPMAYARKLFGVSAHDKKGSLKWEQFLQVMRELGFDYDPSTAGSSVRFDPPNSTDRSITFHKPHPDPTLYQYKLQEYRAKLESYYGWSPEKFAKAVEGLGGASGDEDN